MQKFLAKTNSRRMFLLRGRSLENKKINKNISNDFIQFLTNPVISDDDLFLGRERLQQEDLKILATLYRDSSKPKLSDLIIRGSPIRFIS